MKNKKVSRKAETVNGKKVELDKRTTEFAIILLLLLVSLFVLTLFIFPDLFKTGSSVETTASINATPISVTITKQASVPTDRLSCLRSFGIDPNSVVYFYSNNCQFSAKMTPLVQELQNKGYKIFLANINNVTAINAVTTCLSDTANLDYTPEFVCPTTGADKVGVFTGIEDLKKFADECR